ncbi:N-acetyltransferase family protein [Alteribacillus sp. JSM 102045]|uniref:GNAT family N-acetyltransferase n=1 Tax=Alteribacillus sp. JSM 102045 TaxID=1562101 RepID=UPI0035BFD7BC
MIIRPVKTEDAQAINEIRRQPSVTLNTMSMPSERLEFTKQYLENLSADHHVMVAEYNDYIVGIGSLEGGTGKLRYNGDIALAIHDTYQDRGIGGQLLRVLIDLADNYLGLIRLELDVISNNQKAIHLYKKWGFEIEGCLRKAHFHKGEFQDVLIMGRLK